MANADGAQLSEQHENHVWASIREVRKMIADIEKFKSPNHQDWLENAPENWGYYLNAGPSEDFVIGMRYEQVRSVVKQNILQEKDGRYIMDAARYQKNAFTAYYKNRCKELK